MAGHSGYAAFLMVATTATTATTATVATATTATTATLATGGTLGVVAVLLLIALLITKELASASDNPRAQRLAKLVNVGVVPLAFAFVTIVVTRVMAILA
jgi:hypothetical protein